MVCSLSPSESLPSINDHITSFLLPRLHCPGLDSSTIMFIFSTCNGISFHPIEDVSTGVGNIVYTSLRFSTHLRLQSSVVLLQLQCLRLNYRLHTPNSELPNNGKLEITEYLIMKSSVPTWFVLIQRTQECKKLKIANFLFELCCCQRSKLDEL